MKLWEIAHSRTGDKGNISNVSLIAYDPKDYELIREKVTPERVKAHFKGMVHGDVPCLWICMVRGCPPICWIWKFDFAEGEAFVSVVF